MQAGAGTSWNQNPGGEPGGLRHQDAAYHTETLQNRKVIISLKPLILLRVCSRRSGVSITFQKTVIFLKADGIYEEEWFGNNFGA